MILQELFESFNDVFGGGINLNEADDFNMEEEAKKQFGDDN